MFCKNCGTKLNEGALFCQSCGAKQEVDPNATVVLNQAETSEPVQPSGNAGYTSTPNYNNQPNYSAPQQSNYPNQQNYGANPNFNGQYGYAPQVPNVAPGVYGVSFGEAIKLFFTNYVNFKGRASKSEYWWIFLFNVLVNIPNYILSVIVPPVSGLISLALIIPGLALYVRRMHDIGKHWYRIFIGLIPIAGIIIMIIDLCKDSDGDNEWGYGPNHN